MKTVAIFNDRKRLDKYLGSLERDRGSGRFYIAFEEEDPALRRLLSGNGFIRRDIAPAEEARKEQFLREYIDLIGGVASGVSDPQLWWASDIASKNRFASGLTRSLQQFLNVMDVLRRDDVEHLLVVNPSWTIVSSLRKNLAALSVRLVCPGQRIREWRDVLEGITRKAASTCAHALRLYLRAWYARRYLFSKLKEEFRKRTSFYIIKSFIYDHSLNEEGKYRDPFFGRLPEFIQRQKNVLVLTDILGNYKDCIRKIRKCPAPVIVPLEVFLSLGDILKAAWRILACRITIAPGTAFFGLDAGDILQNELRRTYNSIRIYQLLPYVSVRKLLEYVRADTFLLTFENNPWEKMCMAAFREFSPQTKIVAYQHNVVPQASANMFMSRKEAEVMPRPNLILTTGEAPKRIMERYGYLNGCTIRPACALRHEYLFQLEEQKTFPKGKMILLALEGIFDVYKLVNYVLTQLDRDDRYKIIIRTHPVLPVDAIRHKLFFDLAAVKNVTVSQGMSLKEDIQRSDIVIYWGSTVAMEALWMGKPVIHFDNGGILSYDPLFDCQHLKWIVSPGDDLKAVLARIDSLEEEEYARAREEAKAYLQGYFHAVTEERLGAFLG